MQDVTELSLTCFVFSVDLLRLLYCFRDIPECKNNVQLQRAVHDVLHAGSYEIFAHLLRFFLRATSFTIEFQRHSRMQKLNVRLRSNYHQRAGLDCININAASLCQQALHCFTRAPNGVRLPWIYIACLTSRQCI